MSIKIAIISQSHLCRNPRVLKEAILLAECGYDVTIYTSHLFVDQEKEDELLIASYPNISVIPVFKFYKTGISSFLDRLRFKAGRLLTRYLNIQNEWALGYAAPRYYKVLKNLKADLFICHQELATYTGVKLLKRGFRVAFDFEDWYSEDQLPEQRKSRPIKLLKATEKQAINNAVCCYTTSNAMANALKTYYHAKHTPAVVYNSFENLTEDKLQCNNTSSIRIYWFSQTIGPGRGLEFFIKCVGLSDHKWEIYLRGNISDDYKEQLNRLVTSKDSVNFLPMLANDLLLEDMVNYDFGLALEPDHPPNKDLTISNKLFHYMAAGLPVVASATNGQVEIAEQCPGCIFIYQQNNQEQLITMLNRIAEQQLNSNSINIKKQVLDFYTQNFSWSIQSKKLENLINKALATTSNSSD